jgi:general L-amino acid transport system substrate-binding protein
MRRTHLRTLPGLLAAFLLLIAAACSDDDGGDESAGGNSGGGGGGGGGVLQEVRDRGTLRCGVNNQVPGFGFVEEGGDRAGFDIDYCRAVAAAVLGNPDDVEYEELTPEQRFPALTQGDVDVLIRNTTWTSTRDGADGAAFTTTTFYDGQTVMVPTDANITSIDQLEGSTICMTAGTTTEQNMADRMAGMEYTPRTFAENSEVQDAFLAGQCDAWTSDESQLAGLRSQWPESEGGPEALTILDEVFSKEPLGPAVRDGDSQWYDVVNWVVLATIEAEELGITSDNVEQMMEEESPEVRRFLGQPTETEEGEAVVEYGLGGENGLEPDFTVDVIQAVGNYGEIYERNVGPDTPLQLEREGTPNALWTDGGLHYSPPFR